jgi:hypothetical protein
MITIIFYMDWLSSSESDLEAAKSQETLQGTVEQLLEYNQDAARRLRNLEDSLDARSTITRLLEETSIINDTVEDEDIAATTTRRIKTSSTTENLAIAFRSEFEDDLEASRVYRRNQQNICDCSFVSSAARTNTWSIFSGLSLADVSNISVIALPLCQEDISNYSNYALEGLQQKYPPEGTTVDAVEASTFPDSSSLTPTRLASPRLPSPRLPRSPFPTTLLRRGVSRNTGHYLPLSAQIQDSRDYHIVVLGAGKRSTLGVFTVIYF